MSDQPQWLNDPVAWDDWMQFDDELQANWAAEWLVVQPQDLSESMNEDRSTAGAFTPTLQRVRYPGHTCATCDGPLDFSEQHLNILNANIQCSQDKSSGHLALKCFHSRCERKYAEISELISHGYWHDTWSCAFPGCAQKLSIKMVPYHYRAKHPQSFKCAQCGQAFDLQSELDSHGTKAIHASHVCGFPDCGSQSARITDLIRHQKVHQGVVTRYPCPHCRKYRGENGFKRKDHLKQHIIGYHNIITGTKGGAIRFDCPREGCEKTGADAFEMKKLLAVHLKRDHPSPFQCPEQGCDRVGMKGWMRERDMVKHIAKFHGAQGIEIETHFL